MDELQYRQISVQMKDYFDAGAPTWDARCLPPAEKLGAITALADIQPGAKIADIACGTGVMLSALLKCRPSGILCIDLSEQMIAQAREKFTDPSLRFIAADLFDVDEKGFDVAVIYNAYPHFPDKPRLISHIYGMLRQGGRVVVAHGAGKDIINQAHAGKAVMSNLSWPLKSATDEALAFKDYFQIDILVDTPQFYVLSGIKQNDTSKV